MGAFNTVTAEVACPTCGKNGLFTVQYKYGNTWQHGYDIGSLISWGGNDVGRPKMKRVRVEGIGGPCPHCQADNIDFDILIENDRITEVRPLGPERKEHHREGFIVLEE
jgi:hypothetical protein